MRWRLPGSSTCWFVALVTVGGSGLWCTDGMARLLHTENLTETQVELLKLVKEFVDEQIIPQAQRLEHADEYTTEIVEGMKEMGIFGLMIPEEYGARRKKRP